MKWISHSANNCQEASKKTKITGKSSENQKSNRMSPVKQSFNNKRQYCNWISNKIAHQKKNLKKENFSIVYKTRFLYFKFRKFVSDLVAKNGRIAVLADRGKVWTKYRRATKLPKTVLREYQEKGGPSIGEPQNFLRRAVLREFNKKRKPKTQIQWHKPNITSVVCRIALVLKKLHTPSLSP